MPPRQIKWNSSEKTEQMKNYILEANIEETERIL